MVPSLVRGREDQGNYCFEQVRITSSEVSLINTFLLCTFINRSHLQTRHFNLNHAFSVQEQLTLLCRLIVISILIDYQANETLLETCPFCSMTKYQRPWLEISNCSFWKKNPKPENFNTHFHNEKNQNSKQTKTPPTIQITLP